MTLPRELGSRFVLNWVTSFLAGKRYPNVKFESCPGFPAYNCQSPRLYRTKRAPDSEIDIRIPISVRRPAQAALSEYLHSTRGLQFLDAEYMSKNSPFFLKKLVDKVDVDRDVARRVTRFLRYHPINELEPFFESMGLKPSEYVGLLPRDLMFLSDCDLLVENYHVLCNYGIPRCKIGKIYREAPEVFRCDEGVLTRKIKAYEEMGISQLVLHMIIVISPHILMGDPNVHFCKVMEKFCSLGFELNWITVKLSESETSYCRWSQMLDILSIFEKMGFGDEQLRRLIDEHPGLVFENSGNESASLIGLLMKFGSTKDELRAMFLKFPPMQVRKFVSNIRQCFLFFVEIDMEAEDIDRIIHAETLLLGSCTLKKLNSLLTTLKVGKKQLCQVVTKNPQELKNWVVQLRVEPIRNSGDNDRCNAEKNKFLLGLGFVRDSDDMKRAVKVFRGKRVELQERFDCIVKAGFDREVVCEMVRISPQILNQTKDVLESKIDFLVRELRKPLSSLEKFPAYLSFKMDRIKVRYLMYDWLTEQGVASPNVALSTIIACSEKVFVDNYVTRHPTGVKMWETLKRTSGYK